MSFQTENIGFDVRDGCVPVRQLPDYMIALGEPVVTTGRAAQLVGLERRSVYAGLSRLRRQGRMFSPARGLHVAIPPQHRTWGVVPASWWIDAMMEHLDRSYYVGLLTAAAAHGAAHQSPQVFQVVIDEQLADRDIERVRLRFHVSSVLDDLPEAAIESVTTETGTMEVSTPELTAVDLVAHPNLGGGLDNVATVLLELGPLDAQLLSEVCEHYPRSVVRRLGWMTEHVTDDAAPSGVLRMAEPNAGSATPLDVHGPDGGTRDERWGVLVNTDVQADA